MNRIYNSILDTIGNTPVVRINNLGPTHVNLFAKIEAFNPMGSVKDRMALGVIEDAEQSTPRYRFDLKAAGGPAADEPALEEQAVDAVDQLINNPDQPVTMFALEWCEFCWSVRKMMKAYGIAFQSVDLDSVAYQPGEQGAKLRVALRERTKCNTFPQIFIKGEFIGGCTDLFDRCKDGSLIEMLHQLDIPCRSDITIDPYSLLPGWLHPR